MEIEDDFMDDELLNMEIPNSQDVSMVIIITVALFLSLTCEFSYNQLKPEWKRAPVKKLNPAKDSIAFQQLSVDHIQGLFRLL